MSTPEAIEAIVLATSTNETKSKGRVRKVTFEIPADGPNPFEGMGGERIHIVVVRINNDETPVEEPKSLPAPEKERKSWADMPPAQQAAIRCGEEPFHRFLDEEVCTIHGWDAPSSTDEAAQVVRHFCKVASRADLNTNSRARELWEYLDNGYYAWQRGYR